MTFTQKTTQTNNKWKRSLNFLQSIQTKNSLVLHVASHLKHHSPIHILQLYPTQWDSHKSIQSILFQRSSQVAIIIFCFKNLFTNCNTGRNNKNFLPKLHEIWPADIPFVDVFTQLPCFIKGLFSHSCLKISTNSSNYALFASHSTSFSLNFGINFSNHCFDILTQASSSYG